MKLSLEELKTILASVVTSSKISLSSFNATRDNAVGLLDKVGKIYTLDSVFSIDKLARFDGEYLPFGKTIEEWYQDLILPQDYDSTGANNMAPNDPTYRPVFYSYTLGRKYIPTTIRNNDIERAVHNEGQFTNVVATQAKRLDDSMAQYRYGLKREMIASYIALCKEEMGQGTATPATFAQGTTYNTINTILKSADSAPIQYGILVKKYTANAATNWADAVKKGYIVVLDLIGDVTMPTDTPSANAFIKQIKKDVEKANDVSEGHSLNGNTIGAVEGLTLIVKQGIIPELEVDSFAGAFNRADLAVPADVVVVRDFGSADEDFFAILLDNRGMRLHNTYMATREDFNGKGDFVNLYRHTEDTATLSRNTFVKVYKKPTA